MITEEIYLTFFEKGDRVCTPDGEGVVLEDELIPFTRQGLIDSEVKVELDEETSKGKILEMNVGNLILMKEI